MSKGRIITVANYKGGVGKTTSSYALAVGVSLNNLCCAVIDLEPGGGTYRSLAGAPKDGQPTIADVLYGESNLSDALVPSPARTPGGGMIYTVAFDGRMARLGGVGRSLLHDAIEPIREDVDYIIVDTHPSEDDLRGPIEIADRILIPTRLSSNDLHNSANTVLLAHSLGKLGALSGLLPSDVPRALNAELRRALDPLHQLMLTLSLPGQNGEPDEELFFYRSRAWLEAMNGGGKAIDNPEDAEFARKLLRAVETHTPPKEAWTILLGILLGGNTSGVLDNA